MGYFGQLQMVPVVYGRGVYPPWVEEANPPEPTSPPMVHVGIMAWYMYVLAYAYLN